jgi:acetoacetyl-CoA synthetase
VTGDPPHPPSGRTADEPLWVPPPERVANSLLERFRLSAAERTGLELGDYPALHGWSVQDPDGFWAELWQYLLPEVPLTGPPLRRGGHLAEGEWFPDLRLNVAERILRGLPAGGRGSGTTSAQGSLPDDIMFVAVDERGRRRELSRARAFEAVGEVAAALDEAGVGEGDRVAAWMPNTIETAVVMLAAASLGAVFSSCSPDFGADGVLDRFGQITPTVLVAADGYTYGGTGHDRTEELARIAERLPTVSTVVVVPFLSDEPDLAAVRRSTAARVTLLDEWLAPHRGASLSFRPLPFDHPWYVLFSSGTTGVPKCIVHRAGGVLLQHLKEHQLHLDIRGGDRVAYFTTCGWMMWNWLMSVPASGATAVLFEGNPFHPGPERLWELVGEESLEFLGVSAKYLDAVRKSGYVPSRQAELRTLRTLASTGSPLAAESFDWVMAEVAPGCSPDGLHLASISGGTDLCACFVGGDPTSPVHRGEIQRPALGMDVDVLDEAGEPAAPGVRGELVCSRPFPSMPLGFWGDGPLGRVGPRYRSAYFERLPGVWAQGDFATWTIHGGMVIHGRSDTTLNPGGVRIGTAEIYRQVEQVPEVLESLVFGLERDGDVRIVLLVRLAEDAELDDDLVASIRRRVREGCTPRHVPALVLEVQDLPRTRSGKLVELAVSDRVNGREVRNTSALANPEALDAIAAHPELGG